MTKLIAYMATPGGLTGAPRRLLTLAASLRDHDIDVCIASQSGSRLLLEASAQDHETASIDTVGVLALRQGALFGKGFWFRCQVLVALIRHNWLLLRCIRRKNGDGIWIRGSKGLAYGALGALLSGRPLIWDVDYELPSRGMVRLLHCLGLWASAIVVFQYSEAPDRIFGHRLANRYRRKFTTILPGIDMVRLMSAKQRESHAEYTEAKPFTLLQVGTICDRKNQRLLIDALVKVKRNAPKVAFRCLFAGDVYEEDYVKLIQEELIKHQLIESVTFLGWRDDIHELMAGVDILVMPSKDEGVPNTVQEAMAIGLPVIVSDVGGMPEIVLHGETGWVLSIADSEIWAKHIVMCIGDSLRCQTVGEAAREYAATHFSTESWGREYSKVIQRVVKPAKKS